MTGTLAGSDGVATPAEPAIFYSLTGAKMPLRRNPAGRGEAMRESGGEGEAPVVDRERSGPNFIG